MNNFDKNKKQNQLKYSSTETNIPFHNDDNYFDYRYTQSFLKAQTLMGTGKRFNTKYNDAPGSNFYKIRRFADEVALRGNEINLARIKVREKEKLEKADRERRALLREKWQEEKKYALKMSLRETLLDNIHNPNNNVNTEQMSGENNYNEFNNNNQGLTL